MTKSHPRIFSEREVVILDLPLAENTRILKPEKTMVMVNGHVHDVGAYCYLVRSDKARSVRMPRPVVLNTLQKERGLAIRQLISAASMQIIDGGK